MQPLPVRLRVLAADRRGTAVLEFALVAPAFLLMLLGIIAYGGYFWRAHALQQLANDAARASIAGLTAAERATLARSTVTDEAPGIAGIDPRRATVIVSEQAQTLRVELSYDMSNDAFSHLGLVPMPSGDLRRSAAVRLGGL